MVQSRLLDIAISEFGAKGLEGASTRGIAAAAGTAMSSITYHYGGKEGLYLAAADRIAERMAAVMGEPIDLSPEIATDDAAGARARIHRILGRLADKMASAESADWTLFVLREQMKPSEAFERIYGGVMGQMVRQLGDLVCIVTGHRNVRSARIATITLLGQVVALRSSRATCLKLLERDTLEPSDILDIKARIDANIDAILDSMRAEEQGQA
ncbi:TetR family transcriptional regulator [Sphingomonas sp. BK036]|uniref:CerR family C-terminal domain-containing protein n=1 Tax=Sphingomonas sp. BK036 TaxID=2512122 RepID=UPI00102A741E|nr:CerR family C-terminal domain-containing protein [Sphingomonas sp. BK036]RZT56346.1 TetR family transcriptional regulator [Sphingomonas sp. BK036]